MPWEKVHWGWLRGFWSWSYRGSEVSYTLTEKKILAACEGVQAASEVIGTEAQFLLAPQLSVLGWLFKGKVPSTHHATDMMCSKQNTVITQQTWIWNSSYSGILGDTTNWPEGEDFGLLPSEEEENVMCWGAPPCNQLPVNEKWYPLFTVIFCQIVELPK